VPLTLSSQLFETGGILTITVSVLTLWVRCK